MSSRRGALRPPVDPLLLAWLVAGSLVWGARGLLNPLSRDAAFYVYAGQQVAEGQPPYVGLMNRAGPLAQLLPGLGVWLGRTAGLEDVTSARLISFATLVLALGVTYLVGRDAFDSRLAGCAAAASMLGFEGLALTATSGPQSKHPMMLALALALWLLVRRRWFSAGVATGVATLAWQPVLLALVPAALVLGLAQRTGVRARLRVVVRFGLGGLLTLALTVTGFVLVGALDAFVEGFWSINAGYTRQIGVVDDPGLAWVRLTDWFGWTVWSVAGGCLLSLALGAIAIRQHARMPVVAENTIALAVTTLCGLAWTAFAFQGGPDALLLLPTAAAGIGGTVALAWRVTGLPGRRRGPARTAVVAAFTLWVVVALVATSHLTWTSRGTGLADQRAASTAIFRHLPPGAEVFSDEVPQPLALTRRETISRYLLFGSGMRAYVAAEHAGMQAYVDDLRARAPAVVLAPARGPDRFFRRLVRDYELVGDGPDWLVYLRRDLPLEDRLAVRRDLIDG